MDAADGPQAPLEASLLPLAVGAGALAFAGLAGSSACAASRMRRVVVINHVCAEHGTSDLRYA